MKPTMDAKVAMAFGWKRVRKSFKKSQAPGVWIWKRGREERAELPHYTGDLSAIVDEVNRYPELARMVKDDLNLADIWNPEKVCWSALGYIAFHPLEKTHSGRIEVARG